MATDPAAPPAPRRMYWQLPVFAVGLAAAVLAWRAYPVAFGGNEKQTEQDRYALRQALGKRPADVNEVKGLLAKLGDAGTAAKGNADTAFTLGSAFLLLAEEAGGEENWKQAHALLSDCDPTKLTDKTERARLNYRAAKAAAGCGAGDPTALLPLLDATPLGEEVGERSRLIAELCLRQTPPNTKRAKEQLAAYLSGPQRCPPEAAAKMKLTLADLCTAANEPDVARTWLKQIGDGVSTPVQADAKLRLARLALADGDMNEAVKCFQAAEGLPNLTPTQLATIRYETGYGLVQLGNPTAGKQYLQRATEAGGVVATAAAVRLAQACAKDIDPTAAVPHLETALKGVTTPADWTNPHLKADEARAAGEAVVAACMKGGQYAGAVRAAELTRPLADPTRGHELLADTFTAWATATGTSDPANKWKRAAEEYRALADLASDPTARAGYTGKAAAAFRNAGERVEEGLVLEKEAKKPGAGADVIAAAHLQRAETLIGEKKYDEGVKLLGELTATTGPLGTKAKLKLAMANAMFGKGLLATDPVAGKRRVEEAAGQFSALADGTFSTAEEKLCHQEALYELGKLQLGASVPGVASVRNPSDAETRFRRLVTEHPSGEFADRGHMWLGISLCELAKGEGKGGQPPADAARKFAEARKLFEGLSKSRNDFVRKQADIRLVHTLYLMKDFDATVKIGTDLADTYRGKVEELILLNTVRSAYEWTERTDLAKQTLGRMRLAFDKLPDAEFPNYMDEYRKSHWEAVLKR